MRDQPQRLILLSETNQVMPFAAAVHPTMDGGFTILSFPKSPDPDTAYVEYWQGSGYLEDPSEADAYVLLSSICARVLGPALTPPDEPVVQWRPRPRTTTGCRTFGGPLVGEGLHLLDHEVHDREERRPFTTAWDHSRPAESGQS
ncbi:DUF5753 domain-containing protein [Streptosporangium sp. NBC_01639]|uniref:Scr1 family TA system antitoxin-like transcriptional regulator n=1 Tax=Streptosporangium sp. NBC_01639 TaxID=2975948 RepID=UPI00386C3E0D|nr:DUF5753 domain-containing protein [Streptosporangium sp. NBC_01639]